MDTQEFLKNWLRGCTCSRRTVKRTIEWHDGPYVLLKHHGHKEWVGRFSPQTWCETYYCLYDMRGKAPDVLGDGYLEKWIGRWSKTRQQECELIVENAKRHD